MRFFCTYLSLIYPSIYDTDIEKIHICTFAGVIIKVSKVIIQGLEFWGGGCSMCWNTQVHVRNGNHWDKRAILLLEGNMGGVWKCRYA